MTDPTTVEEFAFGYKGSPGSDNAKLKSLENEGPLVIAKDHVLAIMLKGALDTVSEAPKVVIDLTSMHAATLAHFIYEDEIWKGGMHMAVKSARYSHLFYHLVQAGLDYSPIGVVKGKEALAWKEARRRIATTFTLLDVEKKVLAESDVLRDADSDNAGSGTWFDWMTPKLIATGGGGKEAVAQFANLTPGCFNKTKDHGGRASTEFIDLLDHIEHRLEISALPSSAQAAAVAAWIRRTAPPGGYVSYVMPCDVVCEIERRACKTQAERFQPLFEEDWRMVYPQLNTLWPLPVTDVVNMTAGLAVQLGIGDAAEGLTPQMLTAQSAMLDNLLAFAVSIGNKQRTTEVVDAHLSGRTAPTDGELSSEAKHQLQSNPTYMALVKDVEALPAAEHVQIAKAALEADHPAGLLFLHGKFAAGRVWKERAGARTDATINSVFNEAVSYSLAGEQMEWGVVLKDGVGKSMFIAGKLTKDWWEALSPVVAKRDGSHKVSTINRRVAGQHASTLWTDPERLRVMEAPAKACMKLIKFGGTDAYSFPAYYRTVLRLAVTIENMPASCAPRKGLRKRLQEVVPQQMRCVQDRIEAMLATPPTAAARVTSFVINGQALAAINALEGAVKRIQQDCEDGLHGYARDTNNNYLDDDDDMPATTDPNEKKRKRQEWQHESTDYPTAPAWKQEETSGEVWWGSAATGMGINATPDGKQLAFGQLVAKFDEAPDVKGNCVACFAPGKMFKRNKWCASPGACWSAAGDLAHARLDAFPDEKCKGQDASAIGADLSTFTTVIKARSDGAGGRSGKGGGKGGGGRGGGGRGKGAGKGGGGKGKGKGGKGKGGKGKGGRANAQRFGRH